MNSNITQKFASETRVIRYFQERDVLWAVLIEADVHTDRNQQRDVAHLAGLGLQAALVVAGAATPERPSNLAANVSVGVNSAGDDPGEPAVHVWIALKADTDSSRWSRRVDDPRNYLRGS